MSKYTDSTTNFKLHLATDTYQFTKRNLKIWDMLLNRLGLPDHLQEFVRGVYLAGNWEETEWDEITLMRMARNITSDDNSQLKIFNRLKKNSPKFFEWQNNQSFTLIDREILREHTSPNKTKARYNFLLYEIVNYLFNLPKDISLKALRGIVNETLKDYPMVEKPSRKPKKRKVKSIARAYIRDAQEIIEITGSVQLAAIEIEEENLGDEKIIDLAKNLLQLKDLESKNG